MNDNKKRWSRVAMSICGVLITLSALPVEPLGWIQLGAGLVIAAIPAYWSNSDNFKGKQ
jgi:hypothetical protein